MLEGYPVIVKFFKELISGKNLTALFSIILAMVVWLFLDWKEYKNTNKIILSLLSILIINFIGEVGRRIICWKRNKEEKTLDILLSKSGKLDNFPHTYAYPDEFWPDQDFEGMGWEILKNEQTVEIFLRKPICLECKTDLTGHQNKKRTGFYLECPNCKIQFDVDDIVRQRILANASFQGEARKNREHYFPPSYI